MHPLQALCVNPHFVKVKMVIQAEGWKRRNLSLRNWSVEKMSRSGTCRVPTISVGDALLEVEATGVCGSDSAAYMGKFDFWETPSVLGHENRRHGAFAGTTFQDSSSCASGFAGAVRVADREEANRSGEL